MKQSCARAEILAGAVALGEANETERDEYRRHVAMCAPCLQSLGGEREIERVMSIVVEARNSEVWAPAPVRAGIARPRWRFTFGVGTSVLAAAIVASFGIHTLIAANIRPAQMIAQAPERATTSTFHVSLEKRVKPASGKAAVLASGPVAKVQQIAQAPSIVVVHNVITLEKSKPAQTTTTVDNGPRANDNTAVMPTANPQAVAIAQQPGPVLGGHAESIAVQPSYIIRDVTPLGGVTAINPKPAAIAYAQGAEGTTAFEVAVDATGIPTKCTITKTSGYASLDVSVCKAAMSAKYSPRTINGKAVVGLYRDAFTFRNNNNTDTLLPQ